MKKYRVTDKHEILKKGLLINKKTQSLISNPKMHFGNYTIEQWLNDGHIEQVSKPKFTKDDLVEFLEYVFKSNDRHNEICAIDFVNDWINEKK